MSSEKPTPSVARTVLRGLEINPTMKFVGEFRKAQAYLEKNGHIVRENQTVVLTADGKRLLEEPWLRTEFYRNEIPE